MLSITACVLFAVLQRTGAAPTWPGPLPLGSEWPLVEDFDGFPFPSVASWLDLDADGWPDLFSYARGELWRNQAGQGFVRLPSLIALIPPGGRYGSSAADYDADGFPDIAGEPRDACFALLHALDGRGSYAEVASDPELMLDPPRGMIITVPEGTRPTFLRREFRDS
jgi:hypothetical protein